MGIGRCGRHLGPAPLPGGGRRGRHVYSHFDILRNGFIDDLLHVALVDGLLRILRNGYIDGLLHVALVDGLGGVHRLGLGINVARPAGAVVHRRRNSAPDGELLVAPP